MAALNPGNPGMGRPVRVLSVHPSVGVNGAGKSWILLLRALGGYCELWTSQPGPASEEVRWSTQAVPVNCPQISRRLIGNAYYVLSFPLFVFAYIRLIRDSNIDIVHCNGLYLWQPMLAARICRKRLVVHVREAREKYPDSLYRAWVFYAELLADTIICVSQMDMSNFTRGDITHVPNWIQEGLPPRLPPDQPSPLPPGLEFDSKTVLLVSQIIAGKGHDYAIDVFHNLIRRMPGLKLFIAGGTNGNENNEKFRQEIVSKVAQLGLADDVVFLGHVPDVIPLMRVSGCVLMASRSESFSRVHLEAMSCGSLLFATDVGMTSNIIHDMVDGVIIPWGNAPLAAEKIFRVLSDPRLVSNIRGKAGRKISERFSEIKVAPDFRRIFFGTAPLPPEAPCAAS